MEQFWPKLPLIIPHTEGTQMWWDIGWWVFQIVVMTAMVLLLTRWALKMDEDMGEEVKAERSVSKDTGTPLEM